MMIVTPRAGAMVAECSSLQVLVVDDEKAIADSLAMILRMADCEVRVAYSAESAVEALQSFTPEMVIADVLMGGMNGIELGFYVTDHVPGCTVLLCSGLVDPTAVLDGSDTRTVSFRLYTKPVHPQVVLGLVASERSRRSEARETRMPQADRGKLLAFPACSSA